MSATLPALDWSRVLNICYLLESTELCGGVRVVFDQAKALQARGHQVIVRAKHGDHRWCGSEIIVDYVTDLGQQFPVGSSPDVIVATFWTTVLPALSLDCKAVFHLCQGYEADFIEYSALRQDIEAVYRLPLPKLTIGSWLVQRLQNRYGTNAFECHCVGQIVDLALFRSSFTVYPWLRRRLGLSARILLIGPFAAEVKGIKNALQAVAILRGEGYKIELIRVSGEGLSEAESSITPIDSYHSALRPEQMARLYHHADLLLAPSHEQEGFGLTFAEALASGLPCVATAISSYSSFAQPQDYAAFVPPGEPALMAQSAASLLRNSRQLSFLRRRGPEVVRQFRADRVARRLEEHFWEACRQ